MKFLLVIVILVLGVFIYLKFQILGDPNTAFNQTTRYTLGHYAPVRSLLGMHSAGDAREWYLQGKATLSLEVVQAKGTRLDDKALNNFANEIGNYLGREVVIYDTEFIRNGKLSDADIETIAKGSRHHLLLGEPNMFVVYAEDFDRTGNEVGKTFNEYGIVLSDKALQDLTARHPEALTQYQQSTMLHEFGHLVGLEHNDMANCIMNVSVESPKLDFSFNGTYTPLEFCDYELKQLDALKGVQ